MSAKLNSPFTEKLIRHAHRLGRKKLLLIAVCGISAVAAITLSLIMHFGGAVSASTAENTARAALDAYLKFDSDEMLSLFHEKYVGFAADKYYGGSQSEFKALLKSNADNNKKEFSARYGTWSYSDVTLKSSREYSKNELSALNEDFDALGVGLKASAACKIKLGYTLSYLSSADMRLTEEHTYEAFVVKIGTRWYLFDE